MFRFCVGRWYLCRPQVVLVVTSNHHASLANFISFHHGGSWHLPLRHIRNSTIASSTFPTFHYLLFGRLIDRLWFIMWALSLLTSPQRIIVCFGFVRRLRKPMQGLESCVNQHLFPTRGHIVIKSWARNKMRMTYQQDPNKPYP
jgi:hypothetical protein